MEESRDELQYNNNIVTIQFYYSVNIKVHHLH